MLTDRTTLVFKENTTKTSDIFEDLYTIHKPRVAPQIGKKKESKGKPEAKPEATYQRRQKHRTQSQQAAPNTSRAPPM